MSDASQVDDTLRILLRDLAKESARPTIGRRGPRMSTGGDTVSAMPPSLSARTLVALAAVYGGTVAVLAIFDADITGTFAAVGGVILGIGWVMRGLFLRSRREEETSGRR